MEDIEKRKTRKRNYAKTEKQKEYRRNYMRKWREKNRDKHNENARKSHKRNHHKHLEYFRNYNLNRNFGIDSFDYDVMLKEQNNKCAICGRECKYFSKRLAVDHNHSTGEIRGLLCSNCNGNLGWYEIYKEQIEQYLNKTLINNGEFN